MLALTQSFDCFLKLAILVISLIFSGSPLNSLIPLYMKLLLFKLRLPLVGAILKPDLVAWDGFIVIWSAKYSGFLLERIFLNMTRVLCAPIWWIERLSVAWRSSFVGMFCLKYLTLCCSLLSNSSLQTWFWMTCSLWLSSLVKLLNLSLQFLQQVVWMEFQDLVNLEKIFVVVQT